MKIYINFFSCLFVSFFLINELFSYSSYPIENFWATDGNVRDILVSGNTVYIAGDFNYVGRLTGSGAPISTTTGLIDFPCAVINGTVNVVIPDFSGGWFVGGIFTSVGYESRKNCVHILQDGTVDPNFNISFNSTVLSLALSPDGKTLYTGGDFTDVSGMSRKKFAAIDLSRNTVTDWSPTANNSVNTLAVSPDGKIVYAGGAFTNVSSVPRNHIVAINSENASVSNWNPSVSGEVYTIAISSNGTTVYVGGNFTKIGSSARKYIAAINAENGTVLSEFDPSASLAVNSLVLNADNSLLYVAGNFTHIGGETRKYLAAIHTSDGTVNIWNPSAPNAAVSGISLSPDGNSIYAAGKFTAVSSAARRYLAEFRVSDGSLTNWSANCNSDAISVSVSSDGSKVFAGGTFFSIGGEKRSKLTAIDLLDNVIEPWNPSVDDTVHCLEFSVDKSHIYAGGAFTQIGSVSRNRIAAINTLTGLVSGWDPSADAIVKDIQVSSDGKTVYASGLFTNIGGAKRKYIASLNAKTGKADAWNPSPDGAVNTIKISSDNKTIYAGGAFLNIGGRKQSYITALETETAASKAWQNTANGIVHILQLSSNNNLLYAGGDFTKIGGLARGRVAALLTSNGSAHNWNPIANNSVYSLMISSEGEYVYAGGKFTTLGGLVRTRLGQINTSGSTTTAWNPVAQNFPLALAENIKQNILLTGGTFTSIAGQYCPYFAGFKNNLYHLTVQNGVGDGNYAFGTVVDISAEIPRQGYYFYKWTGSAAYIKDPNSAKTTLIMPASNISVTATYKAYTYLVTFSADSNGTISGNTNQTVSYGESTRSVKAVPNPDYMFDSWTGTDEFFSKANPLLIKNVTKNMEIKANFAPAILTASLTLNSIPPEGGSSSPSGTSQVMLNRPFSISATPAENFYFLNWDGGNNVEVADKNKAKTTAKVYGDVELSANFAIIKDQASVTMAVFPASAGETNPFGTSTIATRDPFQISALASEGFYFYSWIYNSGAAVISNPLAAQTSATVFGDCTITATFVEIPPDHYVSVGKIYNMTPGSAGLADFARNPKTYCTYTNPVSHKPGMKTSLKTASKNTAENAALEWIAKIPLIDKKLWTQDKTASCFDVLERHDPKPLDCRLMASGEDSLGTIAKDYDTGTDLSERLPEILGIFDENGNRINCARANQKIIIKGLFFGKHVPQIWMEYRDNNGTVKQLKLTPDKKNLAFKDYYGKASCMNVSTGESEISAWMPTEWPKNWTHVGEHNIVINNTICRATIQFSTIE